MKAIDLMIGDLLLHKGQPIKVEEILIDGINPMWDGSENYGNEAYYEDLQPIPITPEILEKNGMSRNPYGEYFAEDKHYFLEISREPEGFFWTINANEYGIIPLNYVHELQHALKLCGIEKEVVL